MRSQKLKKRLLLAKCGLSTVQELNAQTNIYSKDEYGRLCSDIKTGIESGKPYTYIVKLVPIKLMPKLKNYIIKNINDLNSFEQAFPSSYSFSELWCCKNDESTQIIHGRFSCASYFSAEIFQQLEIINGNTARLIEKVDTETNIPYIFAEREWWKRHYHITKINAAEDIIEAFSVIARMIEVKEENIDIFNRYISEKEIRSFSLEFIFQNGKLIFIDWDTEDDIRVLN